MTIEGGQEEKAVPFEVRYPRPGVETGYGLSELTLEELNSSEIETVRAEINEFAADQETYYNRMPPQKYDYYPPKQVRDVLRNRARTTERVGGKELAEQFRQLRKELSVRQDIHDAIADYWGWRGDLKTLGTNMFIHPEVALITARHFETLLQIPKLGGQIDAAMRVYNANAVQAKSEQDPPNNGVNTNTELRQLMIGAGKLRNAFAENIVEDNIGRVDELALKAAAVNEAARNWAYNLYQFWGEASFNGLLGTQDSPEDVKGATPADDYTKAMLFMAKRINDEIHPHGPDITVKKGPRRLMVSFLRFATSVEAPAGQAPDRKYTRSFYEQWWKGGQKLGELPWKKVDQTIWRSYLLRAFFVGREKVGLYEFLTAEKPTFDQMTDVGTWRAFHKANNIAIGPWIITEGMYEDWFARHPEARTWEQLDSRDPNSATSKLRQEVEKMYQDGAVFTNEEQMIAGQQLGRGRWADAEKLAVDKARAKSRRETGPIMKLGPVKF